MRQGNLAVWFAYSEHLMTWFDEILSGRGTLAPRPTRRRVGAMVVVLCVALTGFAVAKHAATGGLADHEIEAGITALQRGLHGAEEAFGQAERHFLDAASVSVVDTYPAFLISVGRRMQALRAGGASDGTVHDEIAAALVRDDVTGARDLVGALEGDSPRAARHWTRLIDALESARQ